MNAKKIIEEYFDDSEVVNELLHIFSTDFSAWGEGETAEERIRNTLQALRDYYDDVESTVNEWIKNAQESSK